MPVVTQMFHRMMLALAFFPLALFPLVAHAQKPAPADSAKQKRDSLETVVIRAARASIAAPSAQSTIDRIAIAAQFAGQDAPLFLQRAPSMSSYSESGGFSGYSYVRLRGIDQSRLNITIDGVPLNDPEDQVLYFSNVPDFLNSIQSVQIQRGVGASTFGTASYAGSLNFQSVPLASTARGGELDLTGGSFNTMRASAQYSTGVLGGGWAGYARVSKQHTDGYREHSGNDAQSAFFSGGWFGARDVVKFSGFAGVSGTREAYYAASEDELAVNRRVNPLSDHEGDRFHQEMANLQYAHTVSDNMQFTITGYRNSAAGAFDVDFGAGNGIGNYFLAHVWYGAIAALSLREGDLSLDVGAHLSDYHREHALAMRPTLSVREYTNVGFKQEQSGFAKLALDRGDFRFSADLQVRRAGFRYQPSKDAGIAGVSTDWTFVNPKLGVTWKAATPLVFFVSYGRTSREPTRGDMFAGADDVNQDNAASILPLTRVKPERADDFEAGATWTQGAFRLTANAFAMEFRDEIAAIGALSLTGSPLRKNVDRSYRRGIEFDGAWTPVSAVTATANLTLMTSRIASYRDDAANLTYHDVEPLQTPPVIANESVEWRLTRQVSIIGNGRFVDRAQLANDGNRRLVTPAFWMFDGTVAWQTGRTELRLQLYNIFDANAFAGGYTDGTARFFYPIASRNVLVSTRFSF
jgi:iron complex outermembrane receptor protein